MGFFEELFKGGLFGDEGSNFKEKYEEAIKQEKARKKSEIVNNCVSDFSKFAGVIALRSVASLMGAALLESGKFETHDQASEHVLNDIIKAWKIQFDAQIEQMRKVSDDSEYQKDISDIRTETESIIRSALGLTPTAEDLKSFFDMGDFNVNLN